ncbi:NTE family protein [Scopulibacillus daqui]|uniref:NTE family protein n=1 Tax=Scopulibacillus daqui TaxID=1469162 RepID=A0ABS2PW11_9BACL|nr:patatin-like phospholipase family protein [Scopulibacillus daqui]MBM7644244.1 NTE family protein [Scopulibacillus daqui]
MQRPKIGLALGSGGSKGFAHVGVLKVFEDENIPIDMIAGSSMGGLAAALYGVGHTYESMYKMAVNFKRQYFMDFIIPKMGFISGKKITSLLKTITHCKTFQEARVPLKIVATDLIKGERVTFGEGYLYEAVRASISIPGILVPVKSKGKILVDGGVIDRLPISVVKSMGADIVIAVDVATFNGESQVSSIFDVILQSIDIMQEEIVRHQELHADVIIRPPVNQFNSKAFTNMKEIIKIGEETARQQLPLIYKSIESWKER